VSKRKRKTVLGKTAKKNRSTTNYKRNYPKSYMKKNMKKLKITQVLWVISLLVLGMSGIIFGVAGMIGWRIPDLMIRIIGIVDILMLPTLIVTTVVKVKNAEK